MDFLKKDLDDSNNSNFIILGTYLSQEHFLVKLKTLVKCLFLYGHHMICLHWGFFHLDFALFQHFLWRLFWEVIWFTSLLQCLFSVSFTWLSRKLPFFSKLESNVFKTSPLQDRLSGGLTVSVHADLVDVACPHDLVGRRTVGPGPRFWRVGKGQAGRVDDAVVTDQAHRDLSWLPYPLPASPELWNVGYNAQHAFLTPVHGFSFHIPEPNSQIWREAFPR